MVSSGPLVASLSDGEPPLWPKGQRRRATRRRLPVAGRFRQQLHRVLEQANCLVWQATVHEIFAENHEHFLLDLERGTRLHWEIDIVNRSVSAVPSWLPVAREQGETIFLAWIRSRHPDDERQASITSTEALHSGKPRYTQTFRNRMADGSIRWMYEDVHVQELKPVMERTVSEGRDYSDGKPLRRWKLTGVVTDITERKEAELALEAAMRELDSSRENFRRVIERANCLLWEGEVRELEVATPEDRHIYIFDPTRGTVAAWELRVMNDVEVAHWLPIDWRPGEPFFTALVRARHPGDIAECDQRSRVALLSGADRYTQVFRNFMADGSVRWVQEDVRVETVQTDDPEPGPDGKPLRHWQLTGVMTDVTERKLAEERQKALADDLRQSNAALQEFAYVASHDLKEPLRKIQSFGNLLQRRAGEHLDADAQGYLDRMISAASRMQGLTQALLEFSRVAGKATEIAPIDLNTVASGVIQDLEVRIGEVGATIDLGHLPTVRADALQMRQLFQNLIANSLKFHRPGVPPHIHVFSTEDEEYFALQFADNGIGFSPGHADRIFQIFERLAGRSSPEGNGVGLAICKKIVERHGGTIVAEGCPDKGAIFTVKLPRRLLSASR